MAAIAFELQPESGAVSNVGSANIGDIHLADRWLVHHDDGAVAVYRIHDGAIRYVAKAAIRDGMIYTRAGRNGEPRHDQWDRVARALGVVLERSIGIVGAVSDTQVSDAGQAALQPFVTFDLDMSTGMASNVSTSREHELRPRQSDNVWQIVCVGDRVTAYGLYDGKLSLIGRAVRRGSDVVDATSSVSMLSHEHQWKLVAKGIAHARTLAPDAVPARPRDSSPAKKRRGAIARVLNPPGPWTTRGKIFTTVGAMTFGVLLVMLVRQGIAMGTFPLWGVHVLLVPLAMLLVPFILVYGGYMLTSKEALAERPTKDMYGNSSGDPLTSSGLFLVIVGALGMFYPCGMIGAAKEFAPQVPLVVPTFGTMPSTPTPPTPDAAPKPPTFAETLARTKPTLGDGADNAGAWELARFASAHLAWRDVAITDAETTIPLVLKDSDLERGKRLCATGSLADIERKDLDNRPVFAGTLRTADGDDVRFIAVGSTGSLVKRSTGTICGVVTGRADKAVMLVGMFDLPENAMPAVER
jgi:hypothetical protein